MAKLTPEQSKILKGYFESVDEDKSGSLSSVEIKKFCDKVGFESTEDDIKKVMAKCDPEGSGKVRYEQFEKQVDNFPPKVRGGIIASALFKEIDTDNSGFLTHEDLRKVLKDSGVTEVDDKIVDEMMKNADKDGDGKVNFHEFAKVFFVYMQENPPQ